MLTQQFLFTIGQRIKLERSTILSIKLEARQPNFEASRPHLQSGEERRISGIWEGAAQDPKGEPRCLQLRPVFRQWQSSWGKECHLDSWLLHAKTAKSDAVGRPGWQASQYIWAGVRLWVLCRDLLEVEGAPGENSRRIRAQWEVQVDNQAAPQR